MRGLALWGVTLLLAVPVAWIYDEPLLASYLPIAGLALNISGQLPTPIETAHRHLEFGTLMALDLAAQAIGMIAIIVLAFLSRSVIALVLGGFFTTLAKLFMTWLFLPGTRNRFRLEPAAVTEKVHVGKRFFLSTAFGFLIAQGGKVICGGVLDLRTLGIYNIGCLLASFPVLLGGSVAQQILIPIYRGRLRDGSAPNRRRVRKMRLMMTGGVFALLAVVALGPLAGVGAF